MDTCWSNLTTSDIVYFPGTKIIGTSPDGETDIHILDDPNDGHGTAVTGAVIDANPDAIIFFVEGFSDDAVLAAANQPLVDIITTSFGPIGSVPVPGIEDATKVYYLRMNMLKRVRGNAVLRGPSASAASTAVTARMNMVNRRRTQKAHSFSIFFTALEHNSYVP